MSLKLPRFAGLPIKLTAASALALLAHTPGHTQNTQNTQSTQTAAPTPWSMPCEIAQVNEERVTLAMLKQCASPQSAEAMFKLFEQQRLIDKEQAKQRPRQGDTGDVFRKRQINELAWAVQLIFTQANQPDASTGERQAAASLLQGKPEAAIEALEHMAKNGNTAQAYRAKAALQRTVDFVSASTTLDKALTLTPGHFGLLQAAADSAHIQRKTAEAEKFYQRLVTHAKETLKTQAGDALAQHQLATALDDLGDTLAELNSLPLALSNYQAALNIWQPLLKGQASHLLWQTYTALAWQKLASVQYEQAQYTESASSFQAAQELLQKLVANHAGSKIWPGMAISNGTRLGNTQLRAKQFDAAMQSYNTALSMAAKLNASAPKEPEWQRHMANIYQLIGDLYQFQRQGEAALAQYNAALMLRQKLAGPKDDDDANIQGAIIFIQNRIADLQNHLDLPDAALSNYQAALALATHLANKLKLEEYKLVQANLMGKIGLLEGSELKPAERRAMLQQGVKLLEAKQADLPKFLSDLLEKMRAALPPPTSAAPTASTPP
jgi:tetratricopeptide (TPR) repeat protein